MKTIVERIKERVKVNEETGCWEWQGSRLKGGYGNFWYGSKRDGTYRHGLVHRIVWEQRNGEIPSGMFVCHTCDNPGCCNPEHLFLGTPKDNTQDMIRKGRRGQIDFTPELRARMSESRKGMFAGEKNYFWNNPRPQEEIRKIARNSQLAAKGYFWQEVSQRWRVCWSVAPRKRKNWMFKTEAEAIAKVAELKKQLLEQVNG